VKDVFLATHQTKNMSTLPMNKGNIRLHGLPPCFKVTK